LVADFIVRQGRGDFSVSSKWLGWKFAPGLRLMLVTWAVVAVLLALMLAISAWGWTRIPPGQLMAIHWGLNGRPNSFAPRGVALLMLPAITLAIVLALAGLATTRPAGLRLQHTIVATTAILCAAHVFVVGMGIRRSRG
jgi:uncharacterized membrane protein